MEQLLSCVKISTAKKTRYCVFVNGQKATTVNTWNTTICWLKSILRVAALEKSLYGDRKAYEDYLVSSPEFTIVPGDLETSGKENNIPMAKKEEPVRTRNMIELDFVQEELVVLNPINTRILCIPFTDIERWKTPNSILAYVNN